MSCTRRPDVVVATDKLFLGVDSARESDFTWVTIVNDQNDVIVWFKYPHSLYHDQIEMLNRDLKASGYLEKIIGIRGGDTGPGGAMEILQMNSGLPVGQDSFVKFTMQVNDQFFTNFEQALFKELGQEGRFSYPADHPLAAEFEEQMTALICAYMGAGEYLSASAPELPGAHDDACDSTALALLAANGAGLAKSSSSETMPFWRCRLSGNLIWGCRCGKSRSLYPKQPNSCDGIALRATFRFEEHWHI